MIPTHGHKPQSPTASEVGRDIGSQALRAILKPWKGPSLASHGAGQEPVRGPVGFERLTKRALIGFQCGREHALWMYRRFLCQIGKDPGRNAPVDIPLP